MRFQNIKKNIKSSKKIITEMIRWLEVVDRVEKKNPKPNKNTFSSLYKNNYEIKRRRFKDYARGKILIRDFPNVPLKSIPEKQVRTYLIEHNFIVPRSM